MDTSADNFAVPDFSKILDESKLIKEMASKLIETEEKLRQIERLIPLMEQGPAGVKSQEFTTGLKFIREGVGAIRALLKIEVQTAFQGYLATLDTEKVTPAVDYIVEEILETSRQPGLQSENNHN